MAEATTLIGQKHLGQGLTFCSLVSLSFHLLTSGNHLTHLAYNKKCTGNICMYIHSYVFTKYNSAIKSYKFPVVVKAEWVVYDGYQMFTTERFDPKENCNKLFWGFQRNIF